MFRRVRWHVVKAWSAAGEHVGHGGDDVAIHRQLAMFGMLGQVGRYSWQNRTGMRHGAVAAHANDVRLEAPTHDDGAGRRRLVMVIAQDDGRAVVEKADIDVLAPADEAL